MTGPDRARDAEATAGSVLVALVTCAALLALVRLVQPGRWLAVACLAVALLAAVTGLVRRLTSSSWLPTAAGVGVALAGLVVRYGAVPGGTQLLPTPAAAGRAWALAEEGVALVQDSVVPMPSDRSAELLVVAGAAAVLLLVDALALGAGVPALTALPLGALWVPAVTLGYPTSGWAVFSTGLAYLMLLAVTTAPPGPRGDVVRRSTTALASGAAAVVVALVLAPAVAAFPGWSSVRLPTFGHGPAGPLVLSDNLDLRDNLGSRSAQVVLRYTVSRPESQTSSPGQATPTSPAALPLSIGPLRAFTLSSFDGRQWSRAGDDRVFPFDASSLLGADSTSTDSTSIDPADELDVQVRLQALRETRLPISTFPRTLAIDGTWRYDPQRDEVVGDQATSAGQTYTMQVQVQQLTADQLAAAQAGTPPGGDDYLKVPDTQHLADITARADQIVGNAATAYDKAMALQQYFRSGANFTYDTKVPPATSQDAVWDFLQSRRGYCVQFSSAMALMARILGIPSRVAVGFLPGTFTGNEGEYQVTGKQAHAWPELYFASYGWVRFEPTPAVQTGAPPTWSDPYAGTAASAARGPNDLGRAGQGASAGATTSPGVVHPTTATPVRRSWAPVAVTVGLVLLVLATALLVWWRHLRRPPELTAERAWHTLRRRLAKRRITWSDATTPRAAITAVQERLEEMSGRTLDGPALEALIKLSRAVEDERYAPSHGARTSNELHRWLSESLRGVDGLVSARRRPAAAPTAPPTGP